MRALRFDDTPYRPQIGEVVCARYSMDDEWYRGEVLDICGDKYNLCLIDYGTPEESSPESIRKLHPDLLGNKIVGVKCRLFGTEGYTDKIAWETAYKEHLCEKVLNLIG